MMAITRFRVVHADKDMGNTQTDITNCIEIGEDEGIETRIDTFSLRVLKKGTNITFDCQDGIYIYLGYGDSNPTTLVMDGLITQTDFEVDENGIVWSIKGANRLESMLNSLLPSVYSDKTSSYIVENLIDRLNTQNSDNPNWTNLGKSISATTNSYDYYQPFKSVFQQIEEISQNKYTQNGTYIFYLDTANTFYWQPRPSTTSGTLREGYEIMTYKVKKGTWDTINALIIHAGDDLNGSPIITYTYNLSSIGKLGWKWKYVALTEIAKEIIKNNSGYTNQQVRDAARVMARNLGTELVDRLGVPRFKVDVELRGTTTYTKGGLYDLQLDSYGWNSSNRRLLRITDISHTYNNKGWKTILHFEEDEQIALEDLL